jgi:hypothetical protein
MTCEEFSDGGSKGEVFKNTKREALHTQNLNSIMTAVEK